MNILQVQEQLKNMPKEQLIGEMKRPSGSAPQFLVLSELQRRQRMETSFNAAKDAQKPQTTVADDVVNAAGMPQQGLAGIAQAMAPKTDMAQNTKRMASGGLLSSVSPNVRDYMPDALSNDPAYMTMAQRSGMSPTDYWSSLGPEAKQQHLIRTRRNRFMEMEPMGDGSTMPTQADLDIRNRNAVFDETLGARTRQPAAPAADKLGISALLAETPMEASMTAPGRPQEAARQTYAADMVPVLQAANAEATAPAQREFAPPSNFAAGDMAGIGTYNSRAPEPEGGDPWYMKDFVDPEAAPYSTLKRWVFPGAEVDAAGNPVTGPFAGGAGSTGTPLTSDDIVLPGDEPQAPGEQNITEPSAPATTDLTPEETQQIASGATGNAVSTALATAATTAQTDLDKQLVRDKWFALARAGFALMASKSPTLGGAIGEAGMYGLEAFRQAQMDYDEQRAAEEEMALARQTLAARTAGGGGGGGSSAPRFDPTDLINREYRLRDSLAEAQAAFEMNPTQPMMDHIARLEQDLKITGALINQVYGVTSMPEAGPPVFDVTGG